MFSWVDDGCWAAVWVKAPATIRMQELNFEVEAANAERCRRNLAKSRVRGRVTVPEVYSATKRLLVRPSALASSCSRM